MTAASWLTSSAPKPRKNLASKKKCPACPDHAWRDEDKPRELKPEHKWADKAGWWRMRSLTYLLPSQCVSATSFCCHGWMRLEARPPDRGYGPQSKMKSHATPEPRCVNRRNARKRRTHEEGLATLLDHFGCPPQEKGWSNGGGRENRGAKRTEETGTRTKTSKEKAGGGIDDPSPCHLT